MDYDQIVMDLPRAESRLLRWMLFFAALGLAAILLKGRLQVGIAFAVGAVLGILNFHWLWLTGKALMEVQTAQVPRKTAILLVARYPLILLGLTLLYFSGWLPILPVVVGLLVPGCGVFAESLFLIGAGLHHKQAA
jgi:hypothetical protein